MSDNEKRIFIHAVWNEGNDSFACHAPRCGFIGTLSDSVKHVIENQFRVEPPKPRIRTNTEKW